MPGPSSKPVFAFRHVPFEDLGLIRAPLEERGISIEYPDLYRPGAPAPDVTHAVGAQLIAKALGSKVYRNPVKEIGWLQIHLTEAAARDALFAGIGLAETVFHWHGETFDLPPGAECLAYSDACRNQAFRAAAGVYGLQFHLEVTPAMIEDWCAQDANSGDIDPRQNAARLAVLSSIVFGRWCDLL